MPDGRVVPSAGFNHPSSIQLAEAFKAQAVGTSVPYQSDIGRER